MLARYRGRIIISIGVSIVLCAFVVCGWILYVRASIEPPGIGRKAEAGFRDGAVIIAALERYYSENGSYPENLDALTPEYLEQIPKDTMIASWDYEVTDSSFSLQFTYIGPCVNKCSYDPATSKWKCGGYCY